MTDKTICKIGNVGGDYFRLGFVRTETKKLDYFLNQFNINDYYIIKSTKRLKMVSIEEFLEFNYAQYVFFKKDKYNLKHIELWIKFLKTEISYMYLIKPFPPFDPYEKIKIIDRYDR